MFPKIVRVSGGEAAGDGALQPANVPVCSAVAAADRLVRIATMAAIAFLFTLT